MGTYNPPVDQLLKIGRPEGRKDALDYTALGIGPEHVPDLLLVLNDEELFETEPEAYAQIHAWRALGQLRAAEAVEPLLDLIQQNSGEDRSDWTTEEVPGVLGRFGPSIVPQVVARMRTRNTEYPTIDYANVLVEIGKQHPESRTEVIGQLCGLLETAATNDPTLNGFLISDLIDLKAVEAWPAIERAYATGNVDDSITGDLADTKHLLKLGPKPVRPHLQPRVASPHPTRQSAKQRFDERQRQKHLEKKQKKKRKGK